MVDLTRYAAPAALARAMPWQTLARMRMRMRMRSESVRADFGHGPIARIASPMTALPVRMSAALVLAQMPCGWPA